MFLDMVRGGGSRVSLAACADSDLWADRMLASAASFPLAVDSRDLPTGWSAPGTTYYGIDRMARRIGRGMQPVIRVGGFLSRYAEAGGTNPRAEARQDDVKTGSTILGVDWRCSKPANTRWHWSVKRLADVSMFFGCNITDDTLRCLGTVLARNSANVGTVVELGHGLPYLFQLHLTLGSGPWWRRLRAAKTEAARRSPFVTKDNEV